MDLRPQDEASAWLTGRRACLLAACTGLLLSSQGALVSLASDVPLQEAYLNTAQGYRLTVPPGWEKTDKMGANGLWEDPARRSSSVGVTVNPVRVKCIELFGPLESVGTRLLDAERKKESTLSVAMVTQSSRRLPDSGALLYDFEYDLDSTRGRKRVLNTVTIAGSRLFILNAQYKCEKAVEGSAEEGQCIAAPGSLEQLRAVAASFAVVPIPGGEQQLAFNSACT